MFQITFILILLHVFLRFTLVLIKAFTEMFHVRNYLTKKTEKKKKVQWRSCYSWQILQKLSWPKHSVTIPMTKVFELGFVNNRLALSSFLVFLVSLFLALGGRQPCQRFRLLSASPASSKRPPLHLVPIWSLSFSSRHWQPAIWEPFALITQDPPLLSPLLRLPSPLLPTPPPL